MNIENKRALFLKDLRNQLKKLGVDLNEKTLDWTIKTTERTSKRFFHDIADFTDFYNRSLSVMRIHYELDDVETIHSIAEIYRSYKANFRSEKIKIFKEVFHSQFNKLGMEVEEATEKCITEISEKLLCRVNLKIFMKIISGEINKYPEIFKNMKDSDIDTLKSLLWETYNIIKEQ